MSVSYPELLRLAQLTWEARASHVHDVSLWIPSNVQVADLDGLKVCRFDVGTDARAGVHERLGRLRVDDQVDVGARCRHHKHLYFELGHAHEHFTRTLAEGLNLLEAMALQQPDEQHHYDIDRNDIPSDVSEWRMIWGRSAPARVTNTIARNTGTFYSAVTIANNATQTGAEVDMWGNNTSEGYLSLVQLEYTSTVTAGTIDTSLFYGIVTATEAEDQPVLADSRAPANASQKVQLGGVGNPFPATRFMVGQTKNNATGASMTSATLRYEAIQES